MSDILTAAESKGTTIEVLLVEDSPGDVRLMQEVFRSVFPIRDFSEKAELQFVRYELEEPKYDV